MVETAAHLVEQVFAKVRTRQWVMSFPFELRYLLASRPKVLSRCLAITNSVITGFMAKKLKLKKDEVQSGSVEDLNFPPTLLNMIDIHRGLILVTGPTGSGKSTTLAALIDHVNINESCHIITIEDPIEFVHPNKMIIYIM